MYYSSLSIPYDVLRATRETAQTAPGKMGAYVDSVVRPRVESLVQGKLAPYPGPAHHPFEFATDRSRRYYFASRKGKLPYRRTGDLGRAWKVNIDRRQNDGAISVVNRSPAAIWVIGNRQVEGHRRTGWAKDYPAAVQEIAAVATDLLIDGWYDIVTGVR